MAAVADVAAAADAADVTTRCCVVYIIISPQSAKSLISLDPFIYIPGIMGILSKYPPRSRAAAGAAVTDMVTDTSAKTPPPYPLPKKRILL